MSNARALLESGVGEAVRAEIERLITTNNNLEEERAALASKCDRLEADMNEKETRINQLDADMLEMNALLLQLQKDGGEAHRDPITADVVAASTQVGDHSLNESDDSSGNSRVPESMFDRSVCFFFIRANIFLLLQLTVYVKRCGFVSVNKVNFSYYDLFIV